MSYAEDSIVAVINFVYNTDVQLLNGNMVLKGDVLSALMFFFFSQEAIAPSASFVRKCGPRARCARALAIA